MPLEQLHTRHPPIIGSTNVRLAHSTARENNPGVRSRTKSLLRTLNLCSAGCSTSRHPLPCIGMPDAHIYFARYGPYSFIFLSTECIDKPANPLPKINLPRLSDPFQVHLAVALPDVNLEFPMVHADISVIDKGTRA